MPKQFVPLIGERSTFQQTLQRVADPAMFGRPIVITNADFRFIVAEQLRALGMAADIVLEPARRDSGPAVAVAAALAAQRDPAATVLVLAADHVVRRPEEFREACRAAAVAAAAGRIVTFGICPSAPATSYGYIRPGAKLNGSAVLGVEAFVEKPDVATAARYVADNYLWNSGNFMFRADVMLDEFPLRARDGGGRARGGRRDDAGSGFPPSRRGAVRPRAAQVDRLRRDGTHQARRRGAGRHGLVGTSAAGMRCGTISSAIPAATPSLGRPLCLDSRNSLVRAEDGILTAVVGIDNAVVIATGDAVLVAARDKAEKVKELVEQLKAQNRREAVEHRRSYRPWGYYQGVDAGTRYQVKRIVVKEGASLSLQKHFHRAEHWVVVKGTAEVTLGKDMHTIHENESIYIPIGSVHRLANPGKIPLELIEVQVGSYLGEDDIQRLDGRLWARLTPIRPRFKFAFCSA
jgi:mannose-1-phosphate guanylyltransferase/mannose-6-phosphate isomerase